MENQQKESLPKLTELWEAAEGVVNALHSFLPHVNGPDASTLGDPLARLKKAIRVAGPYCDQIPF